MNASCAPLAGYVVYLWHCDAQNREVYAQASLYPGSLANFNQTPLARDGIFGDDGAALQLATTTGSASSGYATALSVGVAGPTRPTSTAALDLDQRGLAGVWYEPAPPWPGIGTRSFSRFERRWQRLLARRMVHVRYRGGWRGKPALVHVGRRDDRRRCECTGDDP